MTKEKTITELYEFLQEHMVTKKEFAGVESRLGGVESRIGKVESRLGKVESRLGKVESRLDTIESTMLTKDYLEEKMNDLRGDLVLITRKEDEKLFKLIGLLKEKEILNNHEVGELSQMKPFPKLTS